MESHCVSSTYKQLPHKLWWRRCMPCLHYLIIHTVLSGQIRVRPYPPSDLFLAPCDVRWLIRTDTCKFRGHPIGLMDVRLWGVALEALWSIAAARNFFHFGGAIHFTSIKQRRRQLPLHDESVQTVFPLTALDDLIFRRIWGLTVPASRMLLNTQCCWITNKYYIQVFVSHPVVLKMMFCNPFSIQHGYIVACNYTSPTKFNLCYCNSSTIIKIMLVITFGGAVIFDLLQHQWPRDLPHGSYRCFVDDTLCTKSSPIIHSSSLKIMIWCFPLWWSTMPSFASLMIQTSTNSIFCDLNQVSS